MSRFTDNFEKIRLESITNPAALGALARGDVLNALVAATPGGIEAQEKAGQMALVNSTAMPIEMRPDKAAFEKIGFVFGDAIDELFVNAQLPEGWTRKVTDHDMHSIILDEKGRERVSIFYKAAFYDRRADSTLARRYKFREFYGDSTVLTAPDLAKDKDRMAVYDGETEIFRSADYGDRDWNAQDKARAAVKTWMAEHYPLWEDPTAYWNDEAETQKTAAPPQE